MLLFCSSLDCCGNVIMWCLCGQVTEHVRVDADILGVSLAVYSRESLSCRIRPC